MKLKYSKIAAILFCSSFILANNSEAQSVGRVCGRGFVNSIVLNKPYKVSGKTIPDTLEIKLNTDGFDTSQNASRILLYDDTDDNMHGIHNLTRTLLDGMSKRHPVRITTYNKDGNCENKVGTIQVEHCIEEATCNR